MTPLFCFASFTAAMIAIWLFFTLIAILVDIRTDRSYSRQEKHDDRS